MHMTCGGHRWTAERHGCSSVLGLQTAELHTVLSIVPVKSQLGSHATRAIFTDRDEHRCGLSLPLGPILDILLGNVLYSNSTLINI